VTGLAVGEGQAQHVVSIPVFWEVVWQAGASCPKQTYGQQGSNGVGQKLTGQAAPLTGTGVQDV